MKKKTILGSAGLVVAGVLAGSIVSMAGIANAADAAGSVTANSSTVTTSNTPAPSFGDPAGQPAAKGAPNASFDPGGADSIRPDEKTVTGSDADKLKAAAEAKVAGATAFRVETDGDGAAYEVHMKKADGSLVTVKFDKDFNVTSVEEGMGAGGHGGHGPHGPGDRAGASDFTPAAPTAPSTGN